MKCFAILSLCLLPFALGAADIKAIKKILREPVHIMTKDGRTFTGRGKTITPEMIELENAVDGGRVTFNLQKEKIYMIYFPGQETRGLIKELLKKKEYETCLELYEALFRQHVKYFDYLPEEDLRYFYGYLRLAVAQKQYPRIIGLSEALRDYLPDPQMQTFITDVYLLAHHKQGLKTRTHELASKWVKEAGPYANSAIGWWIIADGKFKQEDYEGALWTALFPITFSSQVPMPYLEQCYVLAIASARELKLDEKAAILEVEMQSRHFEWPTEGVESYVQYRPGASSEAPAEAKDEGPPIQFNTTGNEDEMKRKSKERNLPTKTF